MARRLRVDVYEIIMPDDFPPGGEIQVLVINHLTGEVEKGRMRMVPDEDGSYRTAEAVLAALSREAPRD